MNKTIIEPFGPKLVTFGSLCIGDFFALNFDSGGAGKGKLFYKQNFEKHKNNACWMDNGLYGYTCWFDDDLLVIPLDVTITAKVK